MAINGYIVNFLKWPEIVLRLLLDIKPFGTLIYVCIYFTAHRTKCEARQAKLAAKSNQPKINSVMAKQKPAKRARTDEPCDPMLRDSSDEGNSGSDSNEDEK